MRERERQRDRAWVGEKQRERETQNPKQALGYELSAQRPTWGSNPMDREIMTRAGAGCLTD